MTDNQKKCKNCHSFFVGSYCNNCGQKGNENRFTLSNLMETFIHGFYHVHGGLLFTIKELFVRPGEMLRGYISGKRIDYINPFTYLVLVCLIGGFVYSYSGIPNHINDIILASKETILFTDKHLSYRILIIIPIYAVMSSVVFKSFKYNYAEHLIINTFLMSQSMIIMVVWMLVSSFIKPNHEVFKVIYYSSFIVFIIYQTFVFFILFNKGSAIVKVIKSFMVVIIGLGLSFMFMNYISHFIARF